MVDIDTALRRLAKDPAPSRLAATEASILVQIAGQTPAPHDVPAPFRMAAIAVAVVMGVAAGLAPSESASTQHAVTLIGGAAELAPSTLLMGGR